jgi:exonuclease SbcD
VRLLHVSDWHLGRVTYNHSRAEDHDAVLAEIITLARETRPHLIVHSGDVWDSVRPSYSELTRGMEALKELGTVAPTVVLCGNHDSPHLFELLGRIVGPELRLHFVPQPRRPEDGGILEFAGEGEEVVRLAPLPFVHQNRMIDQLEDPATWMAGYSDRVQRLQDTLARGLQKDLDLGRHVLLFAAHLHVTGARFSNSERPLHVTDTYATRVDQLPPVSYAAYGHIHRPQQLPGTTLGWYAGSPISLDFGEEGEAKLALVVEARPGRAARVHAHPLSGGRPLKRLEGTLEQLRRLAPGVGRALCIVTVDTEEPVPDLTEQVRQMLPEAALLNVVERCAATRVTVLGEGDVDISTEPSFSEIFREYVSVRGTREGSADEVVRSFDHLLAAVQQDGEVEFAQLGELRGSEELSKPRQPVA